MIPHLQGPDLKQLTIGSFSNGGSLGSNLGGFIFRSWWLYFFSIYIYILLTLILIFTAIPYFSIENASKNRHCSVDFPMAAQVMPTERWPPHENRWTRRRRCMLLCGNPCGWYKRIQIYFIHICIYVYMWMIYRLYYLIYAGLYSSMMGVLMKTSVFMECFQGFQDADGG